MSTANHNSSKKSSNSSVVNTPASTPVTNINGNPQNSAQNSPPPNNNAPKYGTLVPNRIFVGGISANTTEGELMQLFSSYGTVKAAKIIQDRAGVSKGYGFITFESEDDAKRPLRDSDNIVLRERKLNIAPAIKKQPFSRAFDASSPPAVAAGNPAQFFFPPGAPVSYFQGGVAYYPQPASGGPGDPNSQQPVYQPPPVYQTQTGPPQTATYPSMIPFPQTIYMPQQYPMPMPYDYNYYQSAGGMPAGHTGAGGYMVAGNGGSSGQSGGGNGAQCPPNGAVSLSSNSPPRPPPPAAACYGQQLPHPGAYGAADAAAAAAVAAGAGMFYNVPVYGHPAAMDGGAGPVYADPFDMGGPPGAAYAEDNTYTTMLDHQPQQDLDISQHTTLPQNQHIIYEPTVPPPQTSAIRTATPPSTAVAQNAYPGSKPPSSSRQSPPTRTDTNDTARNSATPVVSLLNIDNKQEKDYDSMQSGRRRKSAPPAPARQTPPNGFLPYHHQHHTNPYVNHTHAPAQVYPFNGHFNGQHVPHMTHSTENYNRFHNNNNNNNNNANKNVKNMMVNGGGGRNRRATFAYADTKRHQNDHSSRSSIRTDSNSSASYVDENKNEQQHENKSYRTTNVTTPPPAPYSPMTNHYRYSGVTRNFRGSAYNSAAYGHRRNYGNNSAAREGAVYGNNAVAKEAVVCTTNEQVSGSQMQNFNPPARRSRRSIRRGATGNEIGAGDAPLPMEDVSKKMESLKM